MNRLAKLTLSIATASALVTFARAGRAWGTNLEQQQLAAASPEAAALVEKADAAARAGRAKEAWELFSQAWPLALRSPLPARGVCRLSLALGIQTEAQWSAARAACQRALLLGGTHDDVRNRVAADLSVRGPLRPTIDDFVSTAGAVAGTVRREPSDAWGYAMQAELALWLRDPDLLDGAVSNLWRVAPDHEETQRALALSLPASAWVWAGRIALALALALTAGHAIARRGWSRRSATEITS